MAVQKDMTKGSPMRLIVQFCIPVMIGNIFQQVYSMTDTIIVGQCLGTGTLAAVGSTGTISFLILGFTMGCCIGFCVPIGQKFGAGNQAGVRRAIGNSVTLSVIITAFISLFSTLFMRTLFAVMHEPADIYEEAYEYIIIICAFALAQTIYTLLACILRSLGNSRVPVMFLIFSAALNIFLDLLFILSFNMGVAGAAWATILAQAIAAALCAVYMYTKMPEYRLSFRDFLPDRSIAMSEIRLGIPMGFQFSITAIGAVMVQTALNLLGSTAVAAFTAGQKIEALIEQIFGGIGASVASFTAQNYGAKRIDRIKAGARAATILSVISAGISSIICVFFGPSMTRLFVTEDLEEIVPMVSTYLNAVSTGMILLALIFEYRNIIQGMDNSFLPLCGGIIELAARAVIALIAQKRMSFSLVCLANPLAWFTAGSFLVICYLVIMKRRYPEVRASGIHEE